MFRDLLREAYAAMRHNRRRTALTMLGMAWGIATVVMLLAYGDGFGRACANIFANFGTKLVIVVPGKLPCRPVVRNLEFKSALLRMMLTRSPPTFPKSLTSRPGSTSRQTCNTTTGISPLPSPATIPTCFPFAPSSYGRAASTTWKTRSNAPA